MHKVPRRKFLSFLSGLPIISDWRDALSTVHPQAATRNQEWRDKFLAVETLRFINTAQKWNFLATGQHVSRPELRSCTGFNRLLEKESTRKRFRSVLEELPATSSFDVPGFDVWVETSADRARYTTVVTKHDPEHPFSFGSDEHGLIFEGRPLGGQTSAYAGMDVLLGDRRAIGTPKQETDSLPPLLATILNNRILNLLPAPQFGGGCVCCPYFPAPCGCTCAPDCLDCPSGKGDCCMNIGCETCIWCREVRCEYICTCEGCQYVCTNTCQCEF